MKKVTGIALLLAVLIFFGFTVSRSWKAAAEGVTISFELPDEGTKGTLSGLNAVIDFDKNDLGNSKIAASVELKTLSTGNKQKDDHLLSADFFDADKHPKILFESTSIKASDRGFIVTGNLSMKDSVKAVEVPFNFTEENGAGVFKGSMEIHPGDFGVTKKSKTGKDKVVVMLTVPVTK